MRTQTPKLPDVIRLWSVLEQLMRSFVNELLCSRLPEIRVGMWPVNYPVFRIKKKILCLRKQSKMLLEGEFSFFMLSLIVSINIIVF